MINLERTCGLCRRSRPHETLNSPAGDALDDRSGVVGARLLWLRSADAEISPERSMADTRFIFHTKASAPVEQESPQDLSAALASDAPHLVIDVRSPSERATGTIAGALEMAPHQIGGHLAALPTSPPPRITLYCATGIRGERAARQLIRLGHPQIANLAGGIAAWRAAGLPTTTPPAPATGTASAETAVISARYSRQTILPQLGPSGQARLAASRVLIVGAGGLGSPSALYLAAAGVGTIGIIDDDVVDVSNLQRQILHTEAAVGALKVDSAATRLRALNSTIQVNTYPARLETENAAALFADFDIVIDGSDNLATRYVINDACVECDIPFVYGALYHFDGQVAVFNLPGGPCYRCLYPAPPPAALSPSCAEAGVLGAICGVVGSLQATAALRVLVGIGDPTRHELFSIDALSMQVRTLSLARDPLCRCGARPKRR